MLPRLAAIVLLASAASAALAQADLPITISPPTENPAAGGDQGGGGTIDLSVAPPTATSAPSALPEGPLVVLRDKQILTADALLGFVNSQPVFAHDIFLRRDLDSDITIGEQLEKMAKTARDLQEFRAAATQLLQNELENLKAEILITSAADSLLTDQDQERINIYLALEQSKLISKYGGSIPAADKALSTLGSSVTKEMTFLRRKITVDLYLSRKLASKIVITRQMVIDAYDHNPQKWQVEGEIELFTLTLPIARKLPKKTTTDGTDVPIDNPTPAQISAAEAATLVQADAIIAELHAAGDSGAAFAQLVEKYNSDDGLARKGGRAAGMKLGSLTNPQLEKFAFSLPAKTTGKPLLIPDPTPARSTVVIVRVGDKKEARTIPFSDAQTTIEKSLHDEQFVNLQREELKKLAGTGAVEAGDRMLSVVVDVATTRYATQK